MEEDRTGINASYYDYLYDSMFYTVDVLLKCSVARVWYIKLIIIMEAYYSLAVCL